MNLARFSVVLYVVFFVVFSKAEKYESCKRRDGLSGGCVPIRSCPKIFNIIIRMSKKTASSADVMYYLNSACQDVKSRRPGKLVCCQEMSEGMQILDAQICGYLYSEPKTYGGHELSILSRPWMALLMFREGNVERFKCGGTLITERFVLTAAHCFNEGDPQFVRLGEYKISNETDCGIVKGKYECAPPVEDIKIDKVIKHENFSKFTGLNDIALIKLSKEVVRDENGKLKNNIRPICLPLNDTLQELAENEEEFLVTGWGKMETANFSDVMLETNINKKTRKDCRNISSSQLCAGDLGFDSCSGDSGGPLFLLTDMYKNLQRFVQLGIVSYGATHCANGEPAVYTNVASYIHWIADNIAHN